MRFVIVHFKDFSSGTEEEKREKSGTKKET